MRCGGNAPGKSGPSGWPCLCQTQAWRLGGTCIDKSEKGLAQLARDGQAVMGRF